MPIIRSSDSKSKSKPAKKDTKRKVKYESESDCSSDSDFYPDSEEDSDYDEESETEYEDEDEEEDDDDDYVTLSDSDSERSQEDEEDELDNDFISNEDEEDEEQPDHKTIRKTIAKIFPSRYMKNKVKADEEKEHTKKNKPEKSNKKTSKGNSKEADKSKAKTKEQKKKEQQKLDKEYREYFEDEDDDFQEDKKKKQGKNINIIFGFGGDDDDYLDEDRFVEDENEECDSDDEKTFMKETYEDVDVPKDADEKKSKGSKRALNTSMTSDNSKKSMDSQEEILQSSKRFENEYRDLVDMKKYLAGRLKANPNSKMIIKSLRDCKDSIKKLVKKARGKNTKEYHKMITGTDRKFTSEIDYFKKKLSNTEQLKIMGDLKEINNFIQIDKPYRLSLLESKIPMSYKSTILQKLNILRTMEPGDPEYYKLKNWIDTFMRIPIGVYRSLDVKMSDGPEVCQEFMEKSIKILDECVYGMNDAKMQILQMVGQWIANPNAMGTAIAIKGPMGTGKCLGLNTPILMHDGSIKMVQDIIVGDVIMGDDSGPRNVLGLGRGQDEMYEIISPKGDKYTVNSEHILSLKPSGLNFIRQIRNANNIIKYKVGIFNTSTYGINYRTFYEEEEAEKYLAENTSENNTVDITVKDYLSLSDSTIKAALKGYRVGIDFEPKPVLFDPYIIGLWLGDGCSAKSQITTQESKILHYMRAELKKDNLNLSYISKYDYSIVGDLHKKTFNAPSENVFTLTLRHYDLVNNKHIPDDYKINDRQTRLKLLAGLLDTDGYYDKKNNMFEITQKNKVLADDILYVARSLGFGASQTRVNKYCMYKGEKREGTYYRINIYGNGLDEIPTLCDRKRAFNRIRNKNPLVYGIRISPVGRGDYYGFEIDGNRRFVMGDFTVTHNTSIVKEGISKILGREFAFIPLGGAGDSSFLEGHSYTYEGSSWGKIIQILIDSKCMNPVIYFDELDKLSDTPRGSEITGILTHLTDTSQNSEFHDKYFSEMGFDLSKCLFIFSYNDESKVNPILRDRMYRIQTKGYNTKEKIIITKNYMLPKIREQVNFSTEDIIIPDDTIEYVITKFTKGEDGVRNLKRCMEIIYTKLNLFRLVKSDSELLTKEINIKVEFPFTVTKKDVDILVKDDEAMNQSFMAMYT